MHRFFSRLAGRWRPSLLAALGVLLIPSWVLADEIDYLGWTARFGEWTRWEVHSWDQPSPPCAGSRESTERLGSDGNSRCTAEYRFSLNGPFAEATVTSTASGDGGSIPLNDDRMVRMNVSAAYKIRAARKLGTVWPWEDLFIYVPVRVRGYGVASASAEPWGEAHANAMARVFGTYSWDAAGTLPAYLQYDIDVRAPASGSPPPPPASDSDSFSTTDHVYAEVWNNPHSYAEFTVVLDATAYAIARLMQWPPQERPWYQGEAWAHAYVDRSSRSIRRGSTRICSKSRSARG